MLGLLSATSLSSSPSSSSSAGVGAGFTLKQKLTCHADVSRWLFIGLSSTELNFLATNALWQTKFSPMCMCMYALGLCVHVCVTWGDKNPVICSSRLNVNAHHYNTFDVCFTTETESKNHSSGNKRHGEVCKRVTRWFASTPARLMVRIRNFYGLTNLLAPKVRQYFAVCLGKQHDESCHYSKKSKNWAKLWTMVLALGCVHK